MKLKQDVADDMRIGAPFELKEIVQTIKGAKFWGEVVSCYKVHKDEWRVDVMAIHEEFYGTIHVYPATQLALKFPTVVALKDYGEG